MRKVILLFFCCIGWNFHLQGQDTTFVNPGESVQNAVAAAEEGAIIKLLDNGDPTIYESGPVVIDKNLTITGIGENVGLSPLSPGNNFITITASGVTLKGLIIDGSNTNISGGLITILAQQTLSNISIQQDSLSNPNGQAILIQGAGGVNGLVVENNYVVNSRTGLEINGPVSGTIAFNNLSGNDLALENNSTQAVDASFNWWGSIIPSLSEINDFTRVDYAPWISIGDDLSTNLDGFQSDATRLSARKTSLSPNALNEAYDALPPIGGTINLYKPVVGVNPRYEVPSVEKNLILVNASSDRLELDTVATANNASFTLQGEFTTDELKLASGSLIINGGSLVLNSTDTNINDQNGTYTGSIVNPPVDIPAGESFSFLGAAISAGSQALVGVTISRINNTVVTFEGDGLSSQSIEVIWDIDVAQDLQEERTLTLTWDSSLDGINNFDDQLAYVWKSEDEGATWNLFSTEQAEVPGTDLRVVRVENVSSFSQWTVSDINNPLPVELISFSASLQEPHILLNWETASETNSDFFAIERSENGMDFKEIGQISSSGNSTEPRQYQYLDEQAARRFHRTLFYRLRMVDFDGTYEYSDITAITPDGATTPQVFAFGRAGQETLKIFTQAVVPGNYQVLITDLSGKKLYEQEVMLSSDEEHRLNIGQLPQSVYTIRCAGQQTTLSGKFRVE